MFHIQKHIFHFLLLRVLLLKMNSLLSQFLYIQHKGSACLKPSVSDGDQQKTISSHLEREGGGGSVRVQCLQREFKQTRFTLARKSRNNGTHF